MSEAMESMNLMVRPFGKFTSWCRLRSTAIPPMISAFELIVPGHGQHLSEWRAGTDAKNFGSA
jgi:hypothetical protein